MSDKQRMVIEIDNVTEAQRIAICDMLATWQEGGQLGCSRWTGFYADGDGNFRPRVTVDGEPVKHQDLVEPGKFWTLGKPWHGEYRIDFDAIAWRLRADPPLGAST